MGSYKDYANKRRNGVNTNTASTSSASASNTSKSYRDFKNKYSTIEDNSEDDRISAGGSYAKMKEAEKLNTAYEDSASLAEIYRQKRMADNANSNSTQRAILGMAYRNNSADDYRNGVNQFEAENSAKYNSAVNEYKKKYNLSDEEYERVYNTYVQDQAQSRAENKNSYSDYVNGDNADEFKADLEKVKEESKYSGVKALVGNTSTEEREAFKAKYNLDEEGLRRIKAEQMDYDKANKYEQVVNNPDFAKKSAIRDENIDDPLAHFRSGEGISDNRVNQFSAVTMDGTQQFGTGLEFDDTTDTGVNQNWDAINEDEEAVYYYLLNTEGKASAENYLYAIQNRLGARAQQQMTQDIKDMGPVGQTAMFVPAVVANAVGGLYSGIEDVMAWITGNEANPYDKAHQLSNFASAVQQGTGEYLEDNTNFKIRGYNVANELYNAVFSTATSAVGAYTFGKAYNFVMGMSAASQKATEMLQQGYDKDQIIASSVATGIAEAFFEKFSLEVFLGAKGGLDVANLLWNIAKQAGAEASEEYFTELANQISDDLILGNESEAARKITTYIEQGLSKEDAEIKLQKERRGERLHSLVGGALSGGMMGGVASVVNQREYKGAAAERGSVEDGNAVEAAAKSAPKLSRLGTEYAKMKIGNKVKSAFGGSGELTNAQIGHLSNLIDESIIKSGVDSNFTEANSAEEAKQIYKKKIAEIDSQYKASSDMVEQDYQDGKISLDAAMDLNERNENDVEKMKQQLKQGLDKTVEAFESGKAKGFKAMQKAYVSEMEKSGNVDRSEGNVGSLSDQRLAELRVPDIETDVGEQAKGFSSQNIVKVENGNITVDIEGNESTVDIGSIKDSTAKVLWAKAAKMPTAAAAQAFIENYSGGSIDSYHNAFKSVYDLAVAGYSEEQTREAASFKWTYLGDNLATKIYNAGLVNAISGASKGFTNMLTRDLKQIVGSQKAKVVKSEIEIVKYVAQKYNIDVVLVDRLDVDGSLKNGQYNRDTGKIILALEGSDEGALLTRTLGHEMYHYLAHNNENGASELEKFVKEYFTKTKSAEWLDKFIEDTYSEYAEDKRMEEFVADQMFDVFSNEKAVYEFAATNKNAFKKLYNHLKKLISDIKTFINDLANKKDDKGNYLYEDMRAFLDNGNEGLQALEKISDMFLAALNDTTGEKLVDIPGVNVQMEFSRARDKEFYNKAKEYNDKQLITEGRVQYVDPLLLNKAAGARARIAIEMEKRKESLALPEDIEGKTNIGNSSYGITEENTTMCPRSLALTEFANAVSEILGRPMTVKEQLILADEASAHYRNNECIYCYVAMDRKAKEEFVGTYLKERNKVVKEVKAGADREEVYQKWLAGEYGGIKRSDKASAALRKRFNMWMNVLDSGKQFIEAKDLASHEAQDRAMTSSDKNIAMQAKDCMKYAQSASYAKKILDYRAYNGHILRWNDKKIKELNNNFGLRMYSFSDYSPAYILENMQMITDASVKGLKMLAYTKEADFVNIFADSGININVSTFGVWDEASGTVIEDQMYGVEWEKAKQLRSEHKNVGVVFVATNDNLVDWALEQDWIDVIIPFHQVKTGDIVAEHFGFHNFTNETEDKKKMGWNKDKHKKSIYPPDHKNDKETYLRLCEENYLSPRFERWKEHPNYMRLVNETRLSSDDTPVVQPIFDLSAALDSLKEMERVGGYVEHVGVRLEETHRLAKEVAEKIKSQTTEVESDYTDYSTARGQQYAPTFFSQMGKVVDGLNQKKFGTQDLVKMLTGRGVKAEEIKWSGIEEWLQDKGKSVTKEELQEFIAGSMLQIEIVDTSKLSTSGLEDAVTFYVVDDETVSYYVDPYDTYYITKNEDDMWMDEGTGEVFYSLEDAKKAVIRNSTEYYEINPRNRWKEYSTRGGENYREVIFKMPNSNYVNNAMDVHWYNPSYGAPIDSGDKKGGILAHARIQDMPDADGNNMLFIEEIQYDWHNEGQKDGYYSGNEIENAKAKYSELISESRSKYEGLRDELNQELRIATNKAEQMFEPDEARRVYSAFSSIINDGEDIARVSFGNESVDRAIELYPDIIEKVNVKNKALEDYTNIRIERNEYTKNIGKVPDAPFKNGKYVDFVLKNLLREAAENGYDKLAWTPSEMQSERWSDAYTEGYKIEYDQDIPKFLNKFGKKFGAKVGVSYINGNEDASYKNSIKEEIAFLEESLPNFEKMYGIDSPEYNEVTTKIENYKRNVLGTPVWSIDITPEMKQSVLYEGQPMYSSQRAKEMDTQYFDAIEKYGEDSEEVANLVRETAKINGYTVKLYHGTYKFGFTKLATSGLEKDINWSPFFATSEHQAAQSYVPHSPYAKIDTKRKISNKDTIALRDGNKEINLESNKGTYSLYANTDNLLDLSFNGERYNNIPFDFTNIKEYKDNKKAANRIIKELNENVEFQTDSWNKSQKIDATEFANIIRFYAKYHLKKNDFVPANMYVNEPYSMVGHLGNARKNAAITYLEGKYGAEWIDNTVDKLRPFLVAEGREKWNTRTICEFLKFTSYDGVILRNIEDDGGRGSWAGKSDVYAFFNPESQVKSADPVTYDDNGNIIPLSQRFNPDSDDMRYSGQRTKGNSNSEFVGRDDIAVYIRNTKNAKYIKMILDGDKTEETRDNNTLDDFIGQVVDLTDGNYTYGKIIFGEPRFIPASEFHNEENQLKHRVPVGDKYDVSGNGKYAYPITVVEKYDQRKRLNKAADYKYSYQARDVKYSNPREVTENDVEILLNKAYKREFRDRTFFPVRVNTPAALILFAKEIRDDTIEDLPVLMKSSKARKSISKRNEWDGEGHGHNIPVKKMIEIIKLMDDPDYIIWQGEYNTYAEIITIDDQPFLASIEKNKELNPKHSNGYDGGNYNLAVTIFDIDEGPFEELFTNQYNTIIYEKGDLQRSSSRYWLSLLNRSPFYDPNLTQDENDVNTDFSTPRQPAYVPEDQDYWNNWINENEKERLFSILDEALNERRGDYTGEGTVNVKRKLNENQIKNIAKSLREEYKSNVNPTEFSNAIEKIYTDILNSNEVMWDSVLLRASVVAKDMLAGTNADEEWTPTEVALKIAENYFRTDEVMTDDLRRYLKKEKSKALKKAQRQKAQDKLDNVRSEYREKIKTERAASKEKLSEMRSEYRGIIKDLKEKHDTEIKERDAEIRYLTRQSERLGKEIDKRKLAEKVRNERRRERASARELRDKIKSRYFKLVKAMEKPTEKQHIPEGLLGMVGEVLGTIDLTENDVRKNGTVIKSRRERNARLADLLVTYNSYAEDPKYNMYYDEGISAMINSIAKDTNGKSVAEMNSSELEDVYNLVKALDHTVRTALKTEIAGKEYQAMWLADEMVEETLSVNGKKDNAINKYWNSQLRADTMFNRLAGYKPNSAWSIAGQLLNDGQLEKTRIMIEGTRAFNDLVSASKDLERLSDINGLVDVGLVNENDEKIMITRGMMLSLYMHLLNEQNARHFERGGVAIPDIKAYYKGNNEKAWGTGKVYTKAYVKTLNDISHKIDLAEYNGDLSEADRLRDQYEDFEREMAERVEGIRVKIENLLGPENSYERQWIRKAQWFFDTFSKDLINNATKKMYGFEKAKVVNYFPIHTDKDSRAAQFDSIKRDFALENSGFMKDRIKGASNTILLEDITDVIADHLKKTADYAGLAPAIKDFNKIYGRAMQTGETSVQRAVNSKFGLAGKRYIEKLLGDLQGANKSENTEIFGINIDRARGHLAQAVLSLNFRVTLAQAASFPTAAAEIGWKPLRKALISIEKDDGTKHYGLSKAEKELIEKYTPLLAWRLQGNSNTELGNIRETRKGSEGWMLQKTSKIMDWISQMDGATVGRLWYASKYYVDDNFSDLKKGSDEYYQKVAEVFNRVVEKTQPNYSVMQRPEILRSTNNIVKAMTMFMTQRLQNFNIIYDSVSKLDKYNKDIKAGKNGITQEDIDRAKTDVVRAVTSQVAASATIVAIKAIVDALMHNFKPYKKKDEDELVWSTVVSKLGNMLIETEVSSMLWGSELYDFLSKMITGETYYGVSVSGVDTINDILNDFTSLRQKPTPAKCFSLAVNVCQFFGIPASNAKKIADMIYDWIADTVDGEVNLNRKGIIDLLNK